MGIVYPQAQLSPAKVEIFRDWLERQDWFTGDPAMLETRRRFGYRFDDPAGEVGIESLLAEADGQLFQLPLTYRAAELPGASDYFLTHMDHSELGQRWVYLGLGDPVFVRAFATAITTAGSSVDVEFSRDGKTVSLELLIRATGTGGGDAPTDLEISGVDVSGPVGTATTSAGTLAFPFRIDPTEKAGDSALAGTGEGLEGTLLAEWKPGN